MKAIIDVCRMNVSTDKAPLKRAAARAHFARVHCAKVLRVWFAHALTFGECALKLNRDNFSEFFFLCWQAPLLAAELLAAELLAAELRVAELRFWWASSAPGGRALLLAGELRS